MRKGKKNVKIPPSQRTLFDFVQKPEAIEPPLIISQKSSCSSQEESLYEEVEKRVIDLVRNHRLNEVLVVFRMAEEMKIQIGKRDLHKLYLKVQDEMTLEFGARLADSLFPSFIFE